MANRSRGRGQISELTHIAPIKQGYIEGRGELRYADRLRTVLEAFNTREDQGYPGVIRLFRRIHSVKWALLDGDTQLMVSVVFDGGLHQYLRALAQDVHGSLGLIWSNCVGWADPSGDEDLLIEFIERYQVRVNFLYAQHPELTVPDVENLILLRATVEEASRAGEAISPDQLLARAYDRSAPISDEQRRRRNLSQCREEEAAKTAFLELLTPLYPQDEVDRAYFETFGNAPRPARERSDREGAGARADRVQSMVLDDLAGSYAARMLLLCFTDSERARAALHALQDKFSFGPRPQRAPYLNIGFTHEGLVRLDVNRSLLSAFPGAFVEGMRARAGQLGDPEQTTPPSWTQVNDPDAPVHAILFLYGSSSSDGELTRLLLAAGQRARSAADEDARLTATDDTGEAQDLQHALTAYLDHVQSALGLVGSWANGLKVIGHHDLHRPLASPNSDPKHAYGVEYFGFRDGVAQPRLPIGNEVEAPDDPVSFDPVLRKEEKGLLADATFLVARKLRQEPGAFWARMQEQAQGLGITKKELAEQIVGRRMDGRRLDSKQDHFNEVRDRHAFDPDATFSNCPYHSHVRRMNPRVERDLHHNPRLMRRSLAFIEQRGERVARGLMFIAFNADIEAQFELIQRNWVQSGNQVGLSSRDRDVISGLLPQGAAKHPARFYPKLHNAKGWHAERARELTFDAAFVTLEWGIYLYFPAKTALRQLA